MASAWTTRVHSEILEKISCVIPQNPVNEAPQKLCSPVSVRWVATYSGDIVDEIQPGSVLLICEERRLVLLDREGISIHVRLILWWAVYVV